MALLAVLAPTGDHNIAHAAAPSSTDVDAASEGMAAVPCRVYGFVKGPYGSSLVVIVIVTQGAMLLGGRGSPMTFVITGGVVAVVYSADKLTLFVSRVDIAKTCAAAILNTSK